MTNNIVEYNLPKTAYASFDAVNLRDLINQRLTESGVFTDQIFVGSHLNAINEIIAVSFHVLLFYLNQTASETRFTQAQLYENMNEIVKLIQYNPTGFQTATATFEVTANPDLAPGFYYIPRYSYISAGGIVYSFNQDILFNKKTPGVPEKLEDVSKTHILYQGKFREFPRYIARGDDYEIINMSLAPRGNNIMIDHHNIHVYVKSALSNTWTMWKPTQSLFMESYNSQRYEIRFNERKFYEIKFGNGLFGQKLNEGDEVVIFYLVSDGTKGEITKNTINGSPLTIYNQTSYNEIMSSVRNVQASPITPSNARTLFFRNDKSTKFQSIETVEEIRQNAPSVLFSRQQLVTTNDFYNFINKNYRNFISDLKVVSHADYINEYVSYFTNMGYRSEKNDPRALISHIKFASTTSFNNVYITAVPGNGILDNERNYQFLSNSHKQVIVEGLKQYKVISLNPVFIDPVYIAHDLGISLNDINNRSEVKLFIKKRADMMTNDELQNLISTTIISFFNKRARLGAKIQLAELYNQIISIGNILQIKTGHTLQDAVDGISIMAWSGVYPKDRMILPQQTEYSFFKYPYWEGDLTNRIIVIT